MGRTEYPDVGAQIHWSIYHACGYRVGLRNDGVEGDTHEAPVGEVAPCWHTVCEHRPIPQSNGISIPVAGGAM